MASVEQLDVGYNQFTGVIPEAICLLPNLQNFTYSHNYFTGDAPSCSVSAGAGKVIDGSQNCIIGEANQRSAEECASPLATPVDCYSFGCIKKPVYTPSPSYTPTYSPPPYTPTYSPSPSYTPTYSPSPSYTPPPTSFGGASSGSYSPSPSYTPSPGYNTPSTPSYNTPSPSYQPPTPPTYTPSPDYYYSSPPPPSTPSYNTPNYPPSSLPPPPPPASGYTPSPAYSTPPPVGYNSPSCVFRYFLVNEIEFLAVFSSSACFSIFAFGCPLSELFLNLAKYKASAKSFSAKNT
ncbi:leucine-rich repeat extensin-like protein 1 [Chenopodium quinoa]|uniref:leucine-rich repeat extensin-like protein 1 n=1 Tax=Chenopodium quinoa TaxID=63459 RepID=UPI000B772220|nr:leucine-rich repeat extensin-like protein 1 [Chenopodium quinoa]